MNDFDDDEDVSCEGWAQPWLNLAELPRMRVDQAALRVAAEAIVQFEPASVVALAARDGDPRLAPFLRAALARQRETS